MAEISRVIQRVATAKPAAAGGGVASPVAVAGLDVVAGLLEALGRVDAALAAVPTGADAFAALSDSDLLAVTSGHARRRDVLARVGAQLAGQVVARSAPVLGSGGLAQRHGYRTPIELVKVVTRSTTQEALTAVRTGTLLVENWREGPIDAGTEVDFASTEPWLRAVAIAVAAGALSPAAADAIRVGLGTPNSSTTWPDLETAVEKLVIAAATVDPDSLRRQARALRDEIDAAGIPTREQERRDARSLRMFDQPSGGGRAVMDFDPESWASAKSLYDRIVSPKLGGPRFTHTGIGALNAEGMQSDAETADRIFADTRTTAQLAFDGFLHLLTAGADADSSQMLGSGAPVVTFLTTISATGVKGDRGWIEGQPDSVSTATVERALETGTAEQITFDQHGSVLEPGTHRRVAELHPGSGHRLFNRKQRRALAARDGGCRWPGCRRPPSWTEAHHIQPWAENGITHTSNGILLCRHHHLLLHNNGWKIDCDTGSTGEVQYWLTPPANLDPTATPRPMPTQSAASQHRARER